MSDAYEKVIHRSSGRCEAMVQISEGVWTRCGRSPVQIHHMLKRARGGELLDEVDETYHLAVVCMNHHMYAEESGRFTGLLIDGYVTKGPNGPVYSGSDPYLKGKYGEAGRS